MRDWYWNDWLTAGIVALAMLWVGGAGVFAFRSMTVERRCLAAGWAGHSVTWDLSGYCIREENEYEITRPVNEVSP